MLYIQNQVNYLDPENLEFAEEPFNRTRRHDEDHAVQYADLASKPKYVAKCCLIFNIATYIHSYIAS